MKAILIDTNAYVAFKRGDAEAVAVFQNAATIGINTVVIGELLSGFAVGSREEENRRDLVKFLDSPRVRIFSVEENTAQHYANVYAALRKAATPIPTNDMWVAASAIEHGLALFSYDLHFRVVAGLRTGASVADMEG